MFGKFIPLFPPAVPNAVDIKKEYEGIRIDSKVEIVKQLKVLKKDKSAKYYDNDANSFVFELALLRDYLKEAEKIGASHVLIIEASYNDTPTSVVAAAKMVQPNSKDFEIVPNSLKEVLEHPGRPASIKTKNTIAGDIIIVTVQ